MQSGLPMSSGMTEWNSQSWSWARLAATLNDFALPGVAWVPVEFTPTDSTFSGEPCRGLQIVVQHQAVVDPLRVGLALATALRDQHGDVWQVDRYDRLLGNAEVFAAFRGGAPADELWRTCQSQLTDFLQRRTKFLLYDP